MLTRRRVVWALVILAAACTLEVVIVCYAPQPVVKVERKTFPDPTGKYVCVLTTRRWVNDDMPFQFMLTVYDAQGNPLQNGTWVTAYYIQTVAWNGDKFTPWDAESPLNGGTCREGKVYWDAGAAADVQKEKAVDTTPHRDGATSRRRNVGADLRVRPLVPRRIRGGQRGAPLYFTPVVANSATPPLRLTRPLP